MSDSQIFRNATPAVAFPLLACAPFAAFTANYEYRLGREWLGREDLSAGGADTSGVKLFHGLIHFAAWIGQTYGVVCLGL